MYSAKQKIKTRIIYLLKRILPGSGILFIMNAASFFLLLIYKGTRYKCICCGQGLSGFVGSSSRKYGYCPRCLSLPRHRFRQLYFERKSFFDDKNMGVLHFAPEKCTFEFFNKLQLSNYIRADLNSPLADEKVDITEIHYPDAFFHVIISSHVLEHVDDDLKAIEEIYRVLKPGGIAITQIPLDHDRMTTYENKNVDTPHKREREYGHLDHKRVYGMDFHVRLKKVGFSVETINSSLFLTPHEKQIFGIDEDEIIFLANKPFPKTSSKQ